MWWDYWDYVQNLFALWQVKNNKGKFNWKEFCDGGSLSVYLKTNKPLDIIKKKQILKDICAGMVHLEKENIIHR